MPSPPALPVALHIRQARFLVVFLGASLFGGQALAGSFSLEAAPPTEVPPVDVAALQIEDQGPVVSGFAKGLPLELVVRQIVPRTLPVSFNPDIDTRQRADWRGGRGWKQVLNDALAPLGLTFAQTGPGIVVSRNALPAAAVGQSQVIVAAPAALPAAPVPVGSPRLPGWRVRGAIAGRAWIIGPSGVSGKPDEIVEGQDYDLLGHVSAIFSRGGEWVVETSKGWFSSQVN
ncbi:hypothetical protein [Telmatospirillum siberiense]|uniref:Uncharacterized protein n=1 Tax=Telmatospirillum siberiense TaxID=382514 RepID=A0A2N3PUE8_9PROT|nr:hypothetical protein [Telmatospirillum siberiense]PKU24024.1 hypothetical protein CWS72_13025 [Telmatospirillum siberiense]